MQHSRILPILFLLVFLPLVAGCGLMQKGAAKEEPGKVKLTGAQIDDLVRGNTLLMEEYGVQAKIELHPDGTIRAFKQDINDQTTGTWAVEEDTLCMKFRRWGSGDELCCAVYKVGEEYQQYNPANGLMTSHFTVVNGVRDMPTTTKTRRPHQTEAPAAAAPEKKAITSTDQPDVVATAPAPAPTIQEESTGRPASPEMARRDLNAIYRDMSQDCPGCNLANINLPKANLMRANLAGANLSGANLAGANLKWANLKGANLERADLSGANLAGAELAGANLDRADLTGANLTKTNLRGASIGGAIGINLKNAIH